MILEMTDVIGGAGNRRLRCGDNPVVKFVTDTQPSLTTSEPRTQPKAVSPNRLAEAAKF
jgi:hypothetical protein